MITNRTIKSPAIAVFAVLLLVSLGVTYFIAHQGVGAGLLILLLSIGLLLLAGVIKNYRVGFYAIFLMGIFMFYVDRIVKVDFPVGTVYDALIVLTFLSLFLQNKNNDWSSFKNPVTIIFIILIAYQVLQFFNPNATSALAWLISLRNNTSFLLYIICFQLFSSLKEVKRYTIVWMAVALLIGAYGIYQNFF